MSTLEERVAALEAMQPNRYYTSRWSGEEIDRRLANAAVPASNPNLLDNWYFPEPVNQRGMTSYVDSSGSGIYTIDRWIIYNKTALTMSDGALSISFPGDPANGTYIMGQLLEQFKALRGKTVTLSLLTSSLSGKVNLFAQFQPDYTGNIQSTSLETAGLISVTFTVPENAAIMLVGVDSFDKTPGIFAPLAIKLELGPNQTLARKNTAGEWEIIDPPDYDLQYSLCSQYSPITGKWVGSQHSNPNLLDNWYFVDPINQRGQEVYTGLGYAIDRWLSNGYNGGSVSLQPDGLFMTENCAIYQFLENGNQILGNTCTLSIITDSELIEVSAVLSNSIVTRTNGNWSFQFGGLYPERLGIAIYPSTGNRTIKAAKLELGSRQTLAHKDASGNWVLNDPPPNFQQELAKCQRYYIDCRANYFVTNIDLYGGYLLSNITFPVKMRSTPTVTIFSPETRTVNVLGNAASGGDLTGFTVFPHVVRDEGFGLMGVVGTTPGSFFGCYTYTADANL